MRPATVKSAKIEADTPLVEGSRSRTRRVPIHILVSSQDSGPLHCTMYLHSYISTACKTSSYSNIRLQYMQAHGLLPAGSNMAGSQSYLHSRRPSRA